MKTVPHIIIDIETIGQPESTIRAKLPPFDPDKVSLGNIKDEAKITAKIAEARLTHGDDLVKKAALYPEYGKVAIAGLFDGTTIDQNLPTSAEKDIIDVTLGAILHYLTEGHIITGWNIKGFDLPYLIKRAWILGIKVPRQIFNPLKPRYPWHESIIDLMEVWSAGVYGDKYASLDTVLATLGLPAKTGNGADFPALWEKDPADGLRYNESDLRLEHSIATRLLP